MLTVRSVPSVDLGESRVRKLCKGRSVSAVARRHRSTACGGRSCFQLEVAAAAFLIKCCARSANVFGGGVHAVSGLSILFHWSTDGAAGVARRSSCSTTRQRPSSRPRRRRQKFCAPMSRQGERLAASSKHLTGERSTSTLPESAYSGALRLRRWLNADVSAFNFVDGGAAIRSPTTSVPRSSLSPLGSSTAAASCR